MLYPRIHRGLPWHAMRTWIAFKTAGKSQKILQKLQDGKFSSSIICFQFWEFPWLNHGCNLDTLRLLVYISFSGASFQFLSDQHCPNCSKLFGQMPSLALSKCAPPSTKFWRTGKYTGTPSAHNLYPSWILTLVQPNILACRLFKSDAKFLA